MSASPGLATGRARKAVSVETLDAPQRLAITHSLALSPRQAEIVELVLQARQQKQIAVDLGLSPHTVRAYMRQIFARVGVENQMELVLVAFALYLRHHAETGQAPLRSTSAAMS
jgi:DNA-binding CsgD family transcriptional regulator